MDLIIIGDSSFAEIAKLYFERDTHYEVKAFVVEDGYLTKDSLMGVPVLPLSAALKIFNPERTYFYVAVVYTNLNRLRTRLFKKLKNLNFLPASYVSPYSFIDSSSKVGDHVFVFEDNTIQPFTRILSNCVLWSGNHIGHHSVINENCFISSHVVISGHVNIGANCFLGVNSTVGNNIDIGEDNWISAGVTILKSTKKNQMWLTDKPVLGKKSPLELFSKGDTGEI